jgi:taurine--2-oxoglutarate transaminase
VLPFTNYHRLHVVPPCTISDDEAREGLAAVDKALTAIGHHYRG